MNLVGKLDLLETLVTIAESNGVAAAASRMKCPPELVLSRVAELELVTGISLLDRATGAGPLTLRGDELQERLAPLVRAMRGVLSAVAEELPRLSGCVTVSVDRDTCQPLVARLVARFAERHPMVQFDLRMTSGDVRHALGGVDVAIVSGLAPKVDGYRSRPLVKGGAWGFYASPAYLQGRPPPRLGAPTHQWLFAAQHAHVFAPLKPSPRLLADDAGTLCELAVAGLGVAFLPRLVARPSELDGRLVRVLEREKVPSGALSALFRAPSPGPAAAAFLSYLLTTIKKEEP